MKKLLFTNLFMITFLISSISITGQAKLTSKNVNVEISGTSTLHDWTMKGIGGSCSAEFTFDGAGKISNVQGMNFTLPINVLKSGKGAMDKNAYKALKSDKNPNISAKFSNATVSANGAINSTVSLTIAGKTVDVPIVSTSKTAGGTINVVAEKAINMVDWDVEPPSFMMGSVKTGKDVKVKVNITFENPIN
ncbi:MAG TPA: YceI family protein [Saprospiraceae bacterium]|nr:YceI family protein [Saprospiraceae bacterium]